MCRAGSERTSPTGATTSMRGGTRSGFCSWTRSIATRTSTAGACRMRKRWRCLAYCLMDNHLHLLLETPDPNLSSGMQWLHGGYAQYFNRRHNRTGHLFQGRYGAVRIKSDGQMCVTARYLARNPVDAGSLPPAVRLALEQLSAWVKWARIAWLDSGRLLEYFGSNEQAAYAMYLGLCEEGVESRQPKGVCPLWCDGGGFVRWGRGRGFGRSLSARRLAGRGGCRGLGRRRCW